MRQYNAAASHVKLDQYAAALSLLEQAKRELGRSDLAWAPDVLVLEATVYYRQGHYQRAKERLASLSLSNADNAEDVDAMQRAHFLHGLIAVQQNDLVQLRQALQALKVTEDNVRMQADYLELSGYTALAEQRFPAALQAFAASSERRSETGDYRGLVRTLNQAGKAAQQAGSLAQAARFWLRAGRSAAAAGVAQQAQELLRAALRLARKAGASELADDAQQLLTRIAP